MARALIAVLIVAGAILGLADQGRRLDPAIVAYVVIAAAVVELWSVERLYWMEMVAASSQNFRL